MNGRKKKKKVKKNTTSCTFETASARTQACTRTENGNLKFRAPCKTSKRAYDFHNNTTVTMISLVAQLAVYRGSDLICIPFSNGVQEFPSVPLFSAVPMNTIVGLSSTIRPYHLYNSVVRAVLHGVTGQVIRPGANGSGKQTIKIIIIIIAIIFTYPYRARLPAVGWYE